jgi:hypothetical protein
MKETTFQIDIDESIAEVPPASNSITDTMAEFFQWVEENPNTCPYCGGDKDEMATCPYCEA